jgi:hypothetical protein
MDIREELKDLLYENKSAHDLRNEIIQEKVQIEKKLQIIQAISLAQKMEKAVKENLFHDFTSITYEIKFYSLDFSVDYSLKIKNRKTHSKVLSSELTDFIDKISLDIRLLNPNYRNYDKLNNLNSIHTFEFKHGIGEEILELFLSKELKTVVDYNKMQLELPNNNESASKKLKI